MPPKVHHPQPRRIVTEGIFVIQERVRENIYGVYRCFCSVLFVNIMASVKYTSTRGADRGTTFRDAVMRGLASDGGLLVPETIPQIPTGALEKWKNMSFPELALNVMGCFVKGDEISRDNLKKVIDASYLNGKWRDEEITPVREMKDGKYVLELFHGPTFAFKDVALQFLGNLFEHILSERSGDEARLTILGATSGDTGSSAIHGVRGKRGIECFIMFPHGAVSDVQRRQMTTVQDKNIHCIAIKGTFDDAQSIVKSLNMDRAFKRKHRLGAVNSINWARILAQIVYYFYAYFRVMEKKRSPGKPGAKVSFSVPTGNFGDILAGYYAKRMGLPVDRFVVATNENNILEIFFRTGKYHRQDSIKTNAPSMDICVSSNFERFLYHMAGDDSKKTASLMQAFEKTSKMEVGGAFLKRCQDVMDASMVKESDRFNTIERYFSSDGYILDPHSSIGVSAISKMNFKSPIVCLACAHWAKFPDAIRTALDNLPERKVKKAMDTPDILKRLFSRSERKSVMENNSASIKDFIDSRMDASGSSNADDEGVYYPPSESRHILGTIAFLAAAAHFLSSRFFQN